MSGVAKIDQTVMVPGATVAMPIGSSVTPYSLGPNLKAAMDMMRVETDDMSESTQDTTSNGVALPNVSATATMKAQQNAQVILGVFGIMIADLIKQVGELVIDCIIQHTTVGEVDALIPEALNMKYKKILVKGKEAGKDITNKIEFDSSMIGEELTKEKADQLEWEMWEKAGGVNSKTIHYKVNPYKFARCQYSVNIDPTMIISRAMGTDQLRKDRAFNLLMDPRVQPFINPQAVVDKYVLEEYSDGNPDEFKKTEQQKAQEQPQVGQGGGNEMLKNIMGNPNLGVTSGLTAPKQ